MRLKYRTRWLEGLGLLALAGLTCFLIVRSWRKWPDPLIDFGRELYLPWRLAHGALLYRDVDDFYGPLSQYLNAGIFSLAGPGLIVLVTANLVIFTAILAALYLLFRSAWGAGAALAASATFVAVFGFSQFVVGSFNYATPYAHEATHGMLVCLLLALVLPRWIDRATPIRSAMAGLLFGLSAVLKPEIMLAAAVITIFAGVIRLRYRKGIGPAAILCWTVGAVLPTAGFAGYFSLQVPWPAALAMASRASLSVVGTTQFTHEVAQVGFLGFDRPWPHLAEHGRATLLAAALMAGLAGAAWGVGRVRPIWLRSLASAVLALAVGWLGLRQINWMGTGNCLLGIALICVGVYAVRVFRSGGSEAEQPAHRARLLIAVLAASLMARMLLNGRIYQFGFYQAALAGALVPAIFLGELPEWVGAGGGRWAKALVVAGSLLLFLPGITAMAGIGRLQLAAKTEVIGEGRDRLYGLPLQVEPTGHFVEIISAFLRQQPADQTLLVLPEGEMINYLARRRSPVAPFFFFSAAISGGREQAIVDQLERTPPDWIVLITRDLREYGVQRYGEAPGKGQLIMQWVAAHYETAASVGDDPLDFRQRGAVILRRRR